MQNIHKYSQLIWGINSSIYTEPEENNYFSKITQVNIRESKNAKILYKFIGYK
jgi:hypothetical protein